MPDLQTTVNKLVACLQHWGLRLNVAKCQLLAWGATKGRFLRVGDETLNAVPEGDHLTIMGLPVRPGTSPHDVVNNLVGKARKCFWANQTMLQSSAPLKIRIQLLYKTVWQSMSWILGVVMPTKQTAETLNGFLYDCILSMVKLRRRPLEAWVDFRIRTRRLARAWAYHSKLERWSTLHLRLTWRYAGHRARGYYYSSPTASSVLTFFRTPSWWEEQQQLQGGARHGRRHFPRITLEEKCFKMVVPGDWRETARNRDQWKHLNTSLCAANDLPWASGTQLSLPSY